MRVLLLIIGLMGLGFAENYAVVVGIDNYKQQGIDNLIGAKNDAVAYRNLLLLNGLKASNIKFLINETATKMNIKNALLWVSEHIQDGDGFYYFHAGHGTILEDKRNFISSALLDNLNKTGILLPHDYSNRDLNSLIITSRDLRPYFEKIDKKVSFGLLAFDSCYSGYAYRGASLMQKGRFLSRKVPPIVINKKNNLGKYKDTYPYQNLYALSASTPDEKSFEDKSKRRGIFTMVLEQCIKERKISNKKSLRICLDREYDPTYIFKSPSSNSNPTFFKINSYQSSKIKIKSSFSLSSLSSFAKFVSHDYDIEIIKTKNGYRLNDNVGMLINSFKDINILKRFVSNYRFIHTKGKKDGDIDIKIISNGMSSNYVSIGSKIKIDVSSSQEGNLAIFSLNKEGKLYMIEPIKRYKKFSGNISILSSVDKPIGTDFLKVILFKNKNSLDRLNVIDKTGEVLNDTVAIETLLNAVSRGEFYEATKKIRVVD